MIACFLKTALGLVLWLLFMCLNRIKLADIARTNGCVVFHMAELHAVSEK